MKAICGANLRRGISGYFVEILEKGMCSVNQRCQVPDDAMKRAFGTQHAQAGGCARTKAVGKPRLSPVLRQHTPGASYMLSQGVSWVTRKVGATIGRGPRSPFTTPNLCHNKA